jgi:hypothetical protein
LKVTWTFGPNRSKKQPRDHPEYKNRAEEDSYSVRKDVPAIIRAELPGFPLFELWWLKSPEQHEQMSIVGVLRLRAAQRFGTR